MARVSGLRSSDRLPARLKVVSIAWTRGWWRLYPQAMGDYLRPSTGDERGSEVQQEEQDDEGDDDQLLDQRLLQRVDAGADERRAVVRRHDLDALGKRRLELLDPRLHCVDDLKSIRAGARDDHAADHLAFAIEIRQAPALRRTDPHRT